MTSETSFKTTQTMRPMDESNQVKIKNLGSMKIPKTKLTAPPYVVLARVELGQGGLMPESPRKAKNGENKPETQLNQKTNL